MQYFNKSISISLSKIIKEGKEEQLIALCDEAIAQLKLKNNDNFIFQILQILNELLNIDNDQFRFQIFSEKILPVLIEFILKNQNHSTSLPMEQRQSLTSLVELYYEYLSLWAHQFPAYQELQPSKYLEKYVLFRKRQKDYKISMRKKNDYVYIKNVSKQTNQKYKDYKRYFMITLSQISCLTEQSNLNQCQSIDGSIIKIENYCCNYNLIQFDNKKILSTKIYKNAQCTGQLKNYKDLSNLQKDIKYSMLNNNKELYFLALTNNNKQFQGKFSIEGEFTTLNITSIDLNLEQQIQILNVVAQKYLS